jgi:hypothetical protein
MEFEKLNEEERASFTEGKCPDCGAPLREGPCGGLSITYLCTRGPTRIALELSLGRYADWERCEVSHG